MTIGDIARSKESEIPNEDFLLLKMTRDEVAKGLGREPEQLELSMGMSEDYEQAITLGATNVRYVAYLPTYGVVERGDGLWGRLFVAN